MFSFRVFQPCVYVCAYTQADRCRSFFFFFFFASVAAADRPHCLKRRPAATVPRHMTELACSRYCDLSFERR